ncbi:MAG: hypothetical protein U9N79_09590 [Actinomycetota bacterium]|nr:hypothetical protein [Actinomycetota bacterium]
MTATLDRIVRPEVNYSVETGHRKIGLGIGLVALMIGMVVAGLGIYAAGLVGSAGDEGTLAQVLAVAFGLNTTALVMLKAAIAVILVGILVRIWIRVESVKTSLSALKPDAEVGTFTSGDIDTEFGAATVSTKAPARLPIHKMANRMWAPMLAMGVMAVVAGLFLSWIWAANVGTSTGLGAAAWTQGLQFLGEGFVLASISFLLASILSGLREGGGEVQEALDLPVMTLKMPNTAKAFVVLMMMGLMIEMVQFGLYIYITTFDDLARYTLWSSWLGPFRELGLGLLLAGIILALATIAKALGFQFSRISDIVATGK